MNITVGKGVIHQLGVILEDLSDCGDKKDERLHARIDRVLDIQQQFLELEKLKFALMKQQYKDQKRKDVSKAMANYL